MKAYSVDIREKIVASHIEEKYRLSSSTQICSKPKSSVKASKTPKKSW